MTTNNKDAPAATGAPSGQMTDLDGKDDTTSLPTLQHRIGAVRLKARVPGMCIALQILPDGATLLTLDEAAQLAAALDELITDLTLDARARTWSENAVKALTRNPSA